MPKKKKEQFKGSIKALPTYCRSFLRLAKKEDDIIAAFINEKGMKEVVEYMVQDILEKYSDKNTFILDEDRLFKIANYLHIVYIESVCAKMVDEGFLSEKLTESGDIVYTRTDKKRENAKIRPEEK